MSLLLPQLCFFICGGSHLAFIIMGKYQSLLLLFLQKKLPLNSFENVLTFYQHKNVTLQSTRTKIIKFSFVQKYITIVFVNSFGDIFFN